MILKRLEHFHFRCRFIDAADAIRVFEVKGQVTTLRPDVKDLEELAIEVEAEDFAEEKDEDGQELVQVTNYKCYLGNVRV